MSQTYPRSFSHIGLSVTDLDAGGTRKYYRVEITQP